MGKKYLSLEMDENRHLLRSTENPNKVRGLSRDENNKNPDIPELEEVSIEDILADNKEYQIERTVEQERLAELQTQESIANLKAAKAELRKSAVNGFVNTLTFLEENPELVIRAIEKTRSLWDSVSNKVHHFSKKIHSRFGKKGASNSLDTSSSSMDSDTKLAEAISPDLSDETTIIDYNDEYEVISSVDEARELLIDTLLSYIEAKEAYQKYQKKINRLSKIRFSNGESLQLQINQMIGMFDNLVTQYPELMSDENLSFRISELLRNNISRTERKQICEVLRIESDFALDDESSSTNMNL